MIVYFCLCFSAGTVDPADIEDLFDQLEDYSDSGPDADTISIGSTPKPSLKPFFCSSRNLLHEARSVVHAAAVAKAQSKSVFYDVWELCVFVSSAAGCLSFFSDE